MIRYIILFTALFALLPQLRGQDCIFNMYIRQGSQYYFSTYYQDYSKSKPLQDTCIQNMNGKPYRFYVFKDGIIQEEKLYYNPDNTLAIEFKRAKHDSVFAEMFSYDNQNRIRQHVSYYYDKGNHRCMKDELYYNGVLNQVRYFRSVHSKELAAAKLEPRPEHLIDSEGYTDFQVQIYEELNYYLTGELKSRQQYQYVVTNNPNSGYITIQSTCTMIGLHMYSTDPVRIREIVRFESGWKIIIYWWGNHNQYSVYDSGEVELYNGIGTPIELLMTEQQYISIPKW